jgi:uncharacterized membrane protein YgaE (UPF0421/DUF939 family)
MKTNESKSDRVIRVVIGVVLGLLVAFKVVTGGFAIALGIVAAIAIITGLVGFCAIYALFGLSTCKIPASK